MFHFTDEFSVLCKHVDHKSFPSTVDLSAKKNSRFQVIPRLSFPLKHPFFLLIYLRLRKMGWF